MILIGDCREQLATLPEKSVHCCVTSPPYWGLRDYGVDGQLGLEPTPEEYVANMVDVFRAVWRVLRDDGVLWLNLGDSYCSGGREGHGTRVGYKQQTNRGMCGENDPVRAPQPPGLKPKDLVGIPWLVAKALQQPYYSGHIMRERDRVWLAATIEAEGTICGFTHERKDGKGVRTGVHIAVTNTSMAMLDECNRIWPTSREDHNPHGNGHLGKRETRRWIAHNVTEKKRLLQEIYPYCISKRKQVVLAYNFMAMSDDAKRLARTAQNEQVTKRRHWIVRALSKLNAGHDVDIPTWCIEPPTLYEPGWYLRSDVIWCLSGGTYLYARTQKGEGVCMVRDLARLDPATVELWNGEKWTRLLGMSKSARRGDELEITLMSGERISCTPTHKWPTRRGLLEASELVPGDVICKAKLPEPDCPRDCTVDEDAAWLAGLYIAEGSRSGHTLQIAGHSREEARWERLARTAAKYGGYATRTVAGNTMNIRLYGKVLFALIDELVTGKTAKDKAFAPVVWRYSNRFIAAMVDGYLSGDGHYDESNKRWRLGFTRNYNLERDLRTACARLGYKLSLKLAEVPYNGRMAKTFRGELRKATSGHYNEHDTAEIVRITKAKCREVYDLGVEDEPHLFALASGVLTHNSKPNPMPESCRDRPTKAHEYLFMLTKSARYYYDAEAVKEPYARQYGDDFGVGANGDYSERGRADAKGWRGDGGLKTTVPGSGRNRRSVWTIATEPFSGAHFATFPRKLIEPCILAGTSARGACPACGAPWQRVVEKTDEPDTSAKGSRFDAGKTAARDGGDRTQEGERTTTRTVGWRPTCDCDAGDPIPCTVLDPFLGSGTTACVAIEHGRAWVGCELNAEYVEIAEQRIAKQRAGLGLFADIGLPAA